MVIFHDIKKAVPGTGTGTTFSSLPDLKVPNLLFESFSPRTCYFYRNGALAVPI